MSRPATAVIEARPWVPRYRAVILAESGKVLASRSFWKLKTARTWALNYAYESELPA